MLVRRRGQLREGHQCVGEVGGRRRRIRRSTHLKEQEIIGKIRAMESAREEKTEKKHTATGHGVGNEEDGIHLE